MRHFFWLHLHRELHGSPSSLLSPLIRSKRRILTIIFCLGKRDILVWWIEDMSVWIILYSIVALLMHKTVGYIWSVSIIFRSISRNMKQSSLNFFPLVADHCLVYKYVSFYRFSYSLFFRNIQHNASAHEEQLSNSARRRRSVFRPSLVWSNRSLVQLFFCETNEPFHLK